MASSKKPRAAATKRTVKASEGGAEKDDGGAFKNRQRKRKLSDVLGPQWSKSELESFYEAYRKYGKDWKKVASAVRNRTTDMVEALFTINKAYLSLPEGSASAAGLIALMIDHYKILELSESDEDSSDGFAASKRLQKQSRLKQKHTSVQKPEKPSSDLLNYKARPPNGGCPSPMKKRRSGGTTFSYSFNKACVRKRTPRFPVQFTMEKQNSAIVKSSKRESVSEDDNDDLEVAKAVALTLAEASQRASSPQVSRTPSRVSLQRRSSSVQNGDLKGSYARNDSGGSAAKPPSVSTMEEGSLDGSQEVENESIAKTDEQQMQGETKPEISNNSKVIARKPQMKKARLHRLEHQLSNNIKEECSSTEEGADVKEDMDEMMIMDPDDTRKRKKPLMQRPRKKGKQLFPRDESSGLDTLAHLADLSLNGLLPSSTVESESSVLAKEEKNDGGRSDRAHKHLKEVDIVGDKARMILNHEKVSHHKIPESTLDVWKKDKHHEDFNVDGACNVSPNDMKKKRRKTHTLKVQPVEVPGEACSGETQKLEDLAGDGSKFRYKSKKFSSSHIVTKNSRLAKPFPVSNTDMEHASSVSASLQETSRNPSGQASLTTKHQSRRKMGMDRAFSNMKAFCPHAVIEQGSNVKAKLVHCLSSAKLRRWCTYEWFYSAIDWPWFSKNEFVDYLNHAGLGHVPRLTRVEWGVIRSSLGKPRRLSQRFLQEERSKLTEYRESVRKHYNEVRAGIRDGLPTDLARPLSVGQRVIACHPKTREVHNGNILTVDRNRCRVQFDRQDLGVEFVLDIDCMPLNPLENMPESFRRKNMVVDGSSQNFENSTLELNPRGWVSGVSPKMNPEMSFGPTSRYCLNTLLNQAKDDTVDSVLQAKAAANEAVAAAQQAMYNPPCTLAQIQAREADIRALAELTRALDKKEAILVELRNMNDEVVTYRKNGETMKNSEAFQRQYATVLHQLKDANSQVTYALVSLRQRNTYQDNSLAQWQHTGRPSMGITSKSIDPSYIFASDLNPQIIDIVNSSRMKARLLLDDTVQELNFSKNGDNMETKIRMPLDSVHFIHGVDSSNNGGKMGSCQDCSKHADKADNLISSSDSDAKVDNVGDKATNGAQKKEISIPSDLITSCVATLYLIQTCTERQYPLADVAQILDNAVTRLQPHSSNNFVVYREIQQRMGALKNQILRLIPGHPGISVSAELPTRK